LVKENDPYYDKEKMEMAREKHEKVFRDEARSIRKEQMEGERQYQKDKRIKDMDEYRKNMDEYRKNIDKARMEASGRGELRDEERLGMRGTEFRYDEMSKSRQALAGMSRMSDSGKMIMYRFKRLSDAVKRVKTDPFKGVSYKINKMPDLGNRKMDINFKLPKFRQVYPKMDINSRFYYSDTINFGGYKRNKKKYKKKKKW